MSKSGDANAESLLRTVLCTRCGYSLEGLPPSGRCPECGLQYSPDLLVIFGRGESGKKTVDWRGRLFGGFVLTAFLCFVFIDRVTPNKYANLIKLFLMLAVAILAIWRRSVLARGMPAETQVQISACGFGCRDGLGDVTLAPWEPTHRVILRALPREWYRLQIKVPRTQFVRAEPLDFMFQADPPTAAAIADRIEQFREGAKVERDYAINELVQRR